MPQKRHARLTNTVMAIFTSFEKNFFIFYYSCIFYYSVYNSPSMPRQLPGSVI